MLAEQRAELIRLRDEVLAATVPATAATTTAVGERRPPTGAAETAAAADELRLTRLRMQGLIDQMAAGVARIDALGHDAARHRARPRRLPGARHRPPGLAVLAARRDRDRLLARPRHRVRRTAAAGRAGDDRAAAVVVGRDGRAKAYRPLPDADAGRGARRAGWPPTSGATSSRPTSCSSRPGWAPTIPAERALLQGLIKLAAAYVHDVRGNPAGIARNLTAPGPAGRGRDGRPSRRRGRHRPRRSWSPTIDAPPRRPRRPSRPAPTLGPPILQGATR